MENFNKKNKGKVVLGIALLGIGAVLLLREFGVNYPNWLLSWPMILIVIGLVNGFKHNFKNSTWIILVLVGGVFLAEKIDSGLSVSQFTWPIILIGLGAWFIFGKHKDYAFVNGGKYRNHKFFNDLDAENKNPDFEPQNQQPSGEETIEAVSIFGGTKKNILSKKFKGGDIVTIMGGTELNLSHADIQGIVVIDVVQIFGGTKIIIPHNWEVATEMAAIFGGIEDKRTASPATDSSKVLLIKGTSVFGGIEIKSF